MAIKTVVTRGYGNGTFNGTIPLVVTRGFTPAQAVVATLQRDVLMAAGILTDVPELAILANVATLPENAVGVSAAVATLPASIVGPIAAAATLPTREIGVYLATA